MGVLEDVRRAVDGIRPRVADAAWPSAVPTPRVAVIGAGFSGLGMAVRLRRRGIDGQNSVLVVERQIEFVLRYLDAMAHRGGRAMDVGPETMAAYNHRVQHVVKHTLACRRETWRPRLRGFAFRR